MDERDAFSSELLNNPNIKEVAWSQDRMVAEMHMTWGRWHHGEQMMLTVMPVSWNFLQVMGIEVFEGRDFLPSDEKGDGAIILNEYAKNKYTIIFRWEPDCGLSQPYKLPIYELYQKYKGQ